MLLVAKDIFSFEMLIMNYRQHIWTFYIVVFCTKIQQRMYTYPMNMAITGLYFLYFTIRYQIDVKFNLVGLVQILGASLQQLYEMYSERQIHIKYIEGLCSGKKGNAQNDQGCHPNDKASVTVDYRTAYSKKLYRFNTNQTSTMQMLKQQEDLMEQEMLLQVQQEINQFYNNIINILPFGLVVVNNEEKLLFCNQIILKLFKCSKEQILDIIFKKKILGADKKSKNLTKTNQFSQYE